MLLKYGQDIITQEANSLKLLAKKLNSDFVKIVSLIIKTKGKVVISGVGKSGHIANKIASTMTSTGSKALFLHPTEASHGDLGILERKDTVICLSNSGKSTELLDIATYCKSNKIKSILITSEKECYLANLVSNVFVIPKISEAGNNLAPSCSTTMMLALGDAIALTVSKKKKFTVKDFGMYHPGGNIGKKFILVKEIMHKDKNIPLATEHCKMSDALIEMSAKGFGCVGIINKSKKLVGVITDGDLRRNMTQNLLSKKTKDIMNLNPKIIFQNDFVTSAIKILNEKEITSLFIVKNKKDFTPIGVLHLHDCLRIK